MKKLFNYFPVLVITLLFASCGKYGYDFINGYQEGDKESSPLLTDTSMNGADRSLFHKARIFPGLVGDNVKRIADTVITFDMNYLNVSKELLKVSVVPKPIFSTGLYAPAGENIRITIPAGITGLTVQVGVHTDNLSGQETLRRDPIIYTRKELFPGVNYVRNLYGGTILLLSNNSRLSPIKIQFAGAVRAPDFILGVTNVQDWISEVEATAVPWIEARSKRVIFSIPRAMVVSYKGKASSIAEALEQWNEIYEKDFYNWMGLEENAAELKNSYPNLPERAVLDIQPSVGYAHSGNPWVAGLDKNWFSIFVDKNYILNLNNMEAFGWGAFHELGHNYQQKDTWSWSGLGETTNNLFIWKFANRLGRIAVASSPETAGVFLTGLEYAETSSSKNIITDKVTSTGNHAFVKMLLFLQIYNKAKGKNGESGWDFMPYLYKNARNTTYSFTLDEAKRDYFYRNLCDFTGQDWQRFCKAWGIRISALARREMSAIYSPLDKSVWTYNPLTNTGGDDVISPKEDFDNTEWKVLYTSTEELYGEPNKNGSASLSIDGSITTYWQSQWSGSIATLPITLIYQLNDNEVVKGFYLVPRKDSDGQRPKKVQIQISKDNVNYRTLTDNDLETGYTFNMANSAARKEFRLKTKEEIRYIKIVFNEKNYSGNAHHGISEFGAFSDVD